MNDSSKQDEELERQYQVRRCLWLLNWELLDSLCTPLNRITRRYIRAGLRLSRAACRGKSAYRAAQLLEGNTEKEYANCGFRPISIRDFYRVVAGESEEVLVSLLQVPVDHP